MCNADLGSLTFPFERMKSTFDFSTMQSHIFINEYIVRFVDTKVHHHAVLRNTATVQYRPFRVYTNT